ncbi:MAG: helix-turn-helix domain-containing protein [Gemmataceae bacterium]
MSQVQAEARSSPELLTSQQVANRLAVSVRTLWRLLAAGKIPQPVRYNRKLVRWKAAELARYIESLSA